MTTATITNTLHKFGLRTRKHADSRLQDFPASVTPKGLVDIIIPVYNEAHSLPLCIELLDDYLGAHFPYKYRITIVDNGSIDTTWKVAEKLQAMYAEVTALHMDQKGRGRALKFAWSRSDADVLAYMDVDLSTDLGALEPLVSPLLKAEAAVATGSRLLKQSRVTRSLKRECISRSYNYILRGALKLRVSDAQCGFKAIRADAAKRLLPEIADNEWFFDTELLVKAERQGLKVHEVPVVWTEDSDSRVKILKTATDDLRGVRRLRSEFSTRAKWERWAMLGILVVSAVLYAIGMLRNGYGNSFYAAAVQAGTHSWKAMFFGSIDASSFITVDKPPFSLWVMEISTRIFGFHTWSMLLPNVLAGLATIYLVYASVRRWFSSTSALLAAAVMALTPVAVMMFAFNNPDAILTLLLTGSMYAFIRALEHVSNRSVLMWLAITGVLTGCAFNAKMLQGFVLVPIFGLVYLLLAPPTFMIRIKHLLFAAIPTAIATLWWPTIVSLIPAANRPYIGSSTDNSIWNLIFGYNGFGRLLGKGSGQGGGMGGFGGRTGGIPTGAAGTMGAMGTPPTGGAALGQMPTMGGAGGGFGGGRTGFGGSTGIFRMFNGDFGPNIAWLIPAALLGIGLVVWLTRRAPRPDRTRLAVLAWGGYLLIHIVLFSMVSGVIHPYYPVVVAPAIAALIGITVPLMIREYKRATGAAMILPIAVAVTGIVACILLGYQATWVPWLRWVVLATTLVSAAGLMLQLIIPMKKLILPLLITAAVACSISPVAYSLATVSVAHTGSIPTAGPAATAMAGSNNETAKAETSFVNYLLAHEGSAKWLVAVDSANTSAAIQITSGQPVMAVGGFNGSDDALTVAQLQKLVASGQLRYYATSASGRGGFGGGGSMGGNSTILAWVEAHGTKVSYGGSSYTLYDLR